MSLRTRLIVAFFLLSVLPLTAVTAFSYRNNAQALRVAAERETDVVAGELGQRMQLVTAQLSERVEHLMDLSALEAENARYAEAAQQQRTAPAPAAPAAPAVPPMPTDTMLTEVRVASALGEAAMLLNNVELRGMRGGGRGRNPPPDPSRAGQTSAGGRAPGEGRGPGGGGANAATRSGSGRPPDAGGSRTGRSDAAARGAAPPAPAGAPPVTPPPMPPPPGTIAGAPTAPRLPAPGSAPRTGPEPAAGAKPGDEQSALMADRMLIDMRPIREELIKQLVPSGQLDKLTPEQRANLGREINARMMGIAQGIRLSAEELQKRAQDAQRQALAAEKAGAATPSVTTISPSGATSTTAVTPKTATTPRSTTTQQTPRTQTSRNTPPPPAPPPTLPPAPPPAPLTRKTAITGNKLGVTVEQDGKVVRQVSAEMNIANVLATVFSTTRRDRGEIPFAVGKDGQIYAQSDADRRTIESLGDVARPDGPATARIGNWIVVTTTNPVGVGLKMGIARPVGDSLNALRLSAARNAGLGLGLIGLALVGIVPLSGRLTRNVTALSDGVKRIAEGDYRARVPVRSQDEIGQLATAFNHMAEEVERHHQSAVEQERIKRELELGRRIQIEMLPHASLRLGLLEVRGVSVPAREVGGDFFNYFELPNHKLALLVGDVSGKGVGAALLMANIQASLRTRLALGQDLSAIANAIDEDVEASSPGPVYATLFVAILDPATRLLQFVNAGHHPQYVVRRNGGLDGMSSTGLPVGLLAGKGYSAGEVQLEAGDMLFFYTDGCVETEDAAGEFFGAERLEHLLANRDASGGIDGLLHRVELEVATFRGSREQFDDATMMAVTIG